MAGSPDISQSVRKNMLSNYREPKHPRALWSTRRVGQGPVLEELQSCPCRFPKEKLKTHGMVRAECMLLTQTGKWGMAHSFVEVERRIKNWG